MSIKLAWKFKGNYIDFPIQTSTELTLEVLKATSDEKALNLLWDDIDNRIDFNDSGDIEWAENVKKHIKERWNTPEFKLVGI